jgi:hypothetical protein
VIIVVFFPIQLPTSFCALYYFWPVYHTTEDVLLPA